MCGIHLCREWPGDSLIRASFLSSLKPVKEIIENLDRWSGASRFRHPSGAKTGSGNQDPRSLNAAFENVREA